MYIIIMSSMIFQIFAVINITRWRRYSDTMSMMSDTCVAGSSFYY